MISTDQPLELSVLATTREVKAVLKLGKRSLKIHVRRLIFQLRFVSFPAGSGIAARAGTIATRAGGRYVRQASGGWRLLVGQAVRVAGSTDAPQLPQNLSAAATLERQLGH